MFTVIIPVFNTPPAQLMECIASIHNQEDVGHILIVDDCSDFISTRCALEYVDSCFKKCRIVPMSENKGTAAALNKGHEYARNYLLTCDDAWIGIMGSQDISHPDKFAKQKEYITKHPDIDVLGVQLFSFDEKDIRRVSRWTSNHAEVPQPRDSNPNWFVNHGGVVYRQSAWAKVGGYNEAWRRGQDVELWGRMNSAGMKFRNLPDVLYGWRRDYGK